ncbi:hypothetical protein DB346_17360 [Verrucomicrobia bacterium LW23]|nr:hypothetical protein DB346_17360 [Verrucomicrobia bacterium LW23]
MEAAIKHYYYADRATKGGPVTYEELLDMCRCGTLSKAAVVYAEGDGERHVRSSWKPITTLGLSDEILAAMPAKGKLVQCCVKSLSGLDFLLLFIFLVVVFWMLATMKG